MARPIFEPIKIKKQTAIRIKHNNKDTFFWATPFGPAAHGAVGELIEREGFMKPTFGELISLIHGAACHKQNNYAKRILKSARNGILMAYNEMEHVPNEGIYISERTGNKKFVPFGYKTDGLSAEDVLKHPVLDVLAEGDEGIDKIVETLELIDNVPNFWGYREINKKTKNVGAIHTNWAGDNMIFITNFVEMGRYGSFGSSYGLMTKK